MDDFEYDYFMVRVRRTPAGTAETRQIGVSGVAERLDTGEKHLFSNGAELLDVMLGGHADPKLPRDSGLRNDDGGRHA